MSSQLQAYARRLAWMRVAEIIDEAELAARQARARASLVVNPMSGRHYGDMLDRQVGSARIGFKAA